VTEATGLTDRGEEAGKGRGMGGGTFVCVVGPSGAGKDTLIRGAQARLGADPRFLFPRRIVTRASSGFEEHDVMAPDVFRRMEAEGCFALSWAAHGLGYAIPLEAKAALAQGAVVTCNLSRRAIAEARSRFGTRRWCW
jgi:ribose 1,5-bisphosphokinase